VDGDGLDFSEVEWWEMPNGLLLNESVFGLIV